MPERTLAELARELGVHATTISRALKRAQETTQDAQPEPGNDHGTAVQGASQSEGTPPVPTPTNPGHPRLRYDQAEVLAWWPHRPRTGQPKADPDAPEMTRSQLAARYGVNHATLNEALETAERRYAAGGRDLPRPPQPVNPDQPRPRYRPQEMDAWWDARRQMLAARSAPSQEETSSG
ncbi:helix-turn-helix domain-containing protein [Streptomyces xiamenensis]|uniref:helix-turn-helix domain-containing protein n=1 Tax=Streptomyces xiamenensis TaxID=408015 RepID=UPI0035DD9153